MSALWLFFGMPGHERLKKGHLLVLSNGDPCSHQTLLIAQSEWPIWVMIVLIGDESQWNVISMTGGSSLSVLHFLVNIPFGVFELPSTTQWPHEFHTWLLFWDSSTLFVASARALVSNFCLKTLPGSIPRGSLPALFNLRRRDFIWNWMSIEFCQKAESSNYSQKWTLPFYASSLDWKISVIKNLIPLL
jgi:hypothetical protein